MSSPARAAARRLVVGLGLAVPLLPGCGDSTGSDTCVVESVTITGLPDTIPALQSLPLSASLLPAVCAGETVTWSATDGVTIDADGRVTGTHLGGPYGVTATAMGVQGTASTTVTVADLVQDSRWALAWTNDSAAADYAVSTTYAYSTGGAIRSSRTDTGAYTVRFPGLASGPGQRQTVHLSAYGPTFPRRCRVLSWDNDQSDLVVQVQCHDLSGAPANSRFDILVVPAGALQGRNAFVVTPASADDPIDALTAHNSSSGMIEVTRTAEGRYLVTFAGLARAGGDPETIHVTTVGPGSNWCKIVEWGGGVGVRTDLTLDVACYTAGGASADARFSVLLLERARQDRRLGFVWANMSTSAAYTPAAAFSFNSAGGPNTAGQNATGEYEVNWPGLERIGGSTAETNLVTAYGPDAVYCQVRVWGDVDQVLVDCYAPNGAAADAQFTAIWIE
jgi:hypothetical protein